MPANAHSARLGGRGIYRLQLGLASAGFGAATAALGAAATTIDISSHGAQRIAVAGHDFTYPALNAGAAMLLALALLGAGVIIVSARAGWRSARATRAFVRNLPHLGPLPGDPSVRVIDDPTPRAFCTGYVRPAVYVSTGALELLSAAELDLVLAHEHHHRMARDPLRLACGRVLSQALFFMPVLRRLHERHSDVAELDADAAALDNRDGTPAALASALLAFSTHGGDAVVGISPARVDSLLGDEPRWRIPLGLLAAAVATTVAFIVLVWRTSTVASAHATLNLPVVSAQPCILVLALLPPLTCAIAITAWRSRAAGRATQEPTATVHTTRCQGPAGSARPEVHSPAVPRVRVQRSD